jgi:hypothetical protein
LNSRGVFSRTNKYLKNNILFFIFKLFFFLKKKKTDALPYLPWYQQAQPPFSSKRVKYGAKTITPSEIKQLYSAKCQKRKNKDALLS